MEIFVIGGGPSGMMSAISAKKHHPDASVNLLERNKVLGKKMRLTGGGRCNISANVDINTIIENTPKNGRFLYSALNSFNAQDTINFFESRGCPLKEEDHGRMFPISNRSIDIINVLEKELRDLGVNIIFDQYVSDLNPDTKEIITEKKRYKYDKLILATGSKVLEGTGSDGSGYKLAEKLNHTITDLYPAEVPLVSNDLFIQEKTLQGLSFKDVNIKVYDHKKKLKSNITHDLLFTHFGISGPAALRSSYEVQKLIDNGVVDIVIDFIPGFNEIDEDHPNLQKRFLDYLNTLEGDLLTNLKHFKMTVYDTRGLRYAFVMNGGVKIKEIDPKTMKSKLNDDISIVGELLDVNSYTGGYNLTVCLACGYHAGKHL